TGSPSNGSHSLQRQSEGARAAIAVRLGSRRRGWYTGSSGPRHCSQIETGPAARSAPQLRQRSGRALSKAREATGAVVDVIETSTKCPDDQRRGRSLFSTLFNVAAIRGKSPRKLLSVVRYPP